MSEVTHLLHAIENGDGQATDQLLPIVYDELRRLAAHRMAAEREGHTLQATALVHEAYLRLLGPDGAKGKQLRWQGRAHFFGAAAEAMRRILIDNARRKNRQKRNGKWPHDALMQSLPAVTIGPVDILALDELLSQFAVLQPQKAELVRLRYFAGLSLVEVAEVMGISRATASRHWAFAKAWLYRELCDNGDKQTSDDATPVRSY